MSFTAQPGYLTGGTSLSAAKGVVRGQSTPFAALRDVPPERGGHPNRRLPFSAPDALSGLPSFPRFAWERAKTPWQFQTARCARPAIAGPVSLALLRNHRL